MFQRTGNIDVKNIACLIAGGLILVMMSPLIIAYVLFVILGVQPKHLSRRNHMVTKA